MNKCSNLPNLEGIGIDLVNFPMECYNYFNYFRADPDHAHNDTFKSIKNLRIFICKESCNHNDTQNMDKLLLFIQQHPYLDGIRIIVNDIEDDGIWDELISITTPNINSQHKNLDISRFNYLNLMLSDLINVVMI